MKGFEICINDAAPIVAMTDSLVTLIISVGYADGDDMHIGGMDSKSNHLIWMNKKMSLGDKIKVRVREIDIASPLHMRYPSDREEMLNTERRLIKLVYPMEGLPCLLVLCRINLRLRQVAQDMLMLVYS